LSQQVRHIVPRRRYEDTAQECPSWNLHFICTSLVSSLAVGVVPLTLFSELANQVLQGGDRAMTIHIQLQNIPTGRGKREKSACLHYSG
jgi:hypothetical protein